MANPIHFNPYRGIWCFKFNPDSRVDWDETKVHEAIDFFYANLDKPGNNDNDKVWNCGHFDKMGYRFSIQWDNPDFKEYLARRDYVGEFYRHTAPADKNLAIAWAINAGAEELYEMPEDNLLKR